MGEPFPGQEVHGFGEDGRSHGQEHDQGRVPDHPVVHVVQVEGDDGAAEQVEDVARGVLLAVRDHHVGEQLPVHPDRHRELRRHRRRENEAVVPPGPPQQHEDQREQQVELHDHDQEVQLVVADLEQVAKVRQRHGRGSGIGRVVQHVGEPQEVDEVPAEVGDSDRDEPAPVERAPAVTLQPGVGVRQHARGNEEEHLARHVQQKQRGVGEHGRPRGREGDDRVRADHADLLERAHGVDLVEPLTARHQYIIRGSR